MRLLILLFFILFLPLLSLADTFVTFEENGKVGLKNQAGAVMIPAVYDALGWSNGSSLFQARLRVTNSTDPGG